MDTMGMTISPDGNLVTADSLGVREWRDLKRDFLVRRAKGDDVVALSPCGRWAATPSEIRDHLQLTDLGTGQVLGEVPGSKAKFGGNGEHVVVWEPANATANESIEYHIWKLDSDLKDPFRIFQGIRSFNPNPSPDGESLLLPYKAHWVEAHLAGLEEAQRWRFANQIFCTAWSSDGKLIVTGQHSGEIQLRFTGDPEPYQVFKSKRDSVNAIAFSGDSNQLAVGGEDGQIDLFDVSHFVEATSEQTSPDGKEEFTIASLDPPRLSGSLSAHVQDVREVLFSSDGSKLASRDSVGTVKLWNLTETPGLVPRIEDHEFVLAASTNTWWEDTSDGVRLRKHSPDAELDVSGHLKAGDRLTAVSDDNGFSRYRCENRRE